MTKRIFVFLSVHFLYLVTCTTGSLQAQDVHSGISPLSIPLAVRQQYFKKGNLVPNAGFEQASISGNDSLNFNFSLSGWTVVGKNVQLTDRANSKIYHDNDAMEGSHAIKIVRADSDVQEIDNPPEGILSDYIEVIPANFDFYFDLRLEKIIPTTYLDRMQTRIGNNIDVRLIFYDKDKREMESGSYFEYAGKKIDNGFKGFAFSNYFLVNRFDWARVHGQTWNYPYSEGDMPGKCKFVKIFLGLRCSGSMWVDNIDFRLSKWNFTPLERIDSLFGRKYELSRLLIPEPKSVKNARHLDFRNKKVDVVFSGPQSAESSSAIRLLLNHFGKLKWAHISSKSTPSAGGVQIILLSPAAGLVKFADAFRAIEHRDQGYFIRREGNAIYLGANQGVGFFYAAGTLCQLIDYKNGFIDYADITDYPDFSGRSVQLGTYPDRWTLEQNKSLTDSAIQQQLLQNQRNLEVQLDDLNFYAFYKINQAYSYASFTKKWWDPGDFFFGLYHKLGEAHARFGNILNTAVQINPYFHLGKEEQVDSLTDSLRNIFSIGSDEGFEKIRRVLKPLLDDGVKTVQLCSDDFVPHSNIIRGEYTLFTSSDKNQFTNLAAAHSFLIDRLKKWIDGNYQHVRLEFIPPQYNNKFIDYGRGSAETYFRDLTAHLDSSVVLIWTGNTIRSLVYDAADIRKATELYNSKPMIFDNTPYARGVEIANGGYPFNYPERSMLCNLFEPFDIQYPKDFFTMLNDRYYSNLGGFGEMNKIKYMSFSDFTWNSDAYDADFSLFKSLVQYVGQDNALLLLRFNDAYYQFVSSWGALRINLAHHSDYRCPEKLRTQAEKQIAALERAYGALQPLTNEALKKELKNTMDSKIAAWRKLSQPASLQ